MLLCSITKNEHINIISLKWLFEGVWATLFVILLFFKRAWFAIAIIARTCNKANGGVFFFSSDSVSFQICDCVLCDIAVHDNALRQTVFSIAIYITFLNAYKCNQWNDVWVSQLVSEWMKPMTTRNGKTKTQTLSFKMAWSRFAFSFLLLLAQYINS